MKVIEIIDKYIEGDIVVVGSSLGGWLSLLAAVNRKARHDYFIEDSYECGIALQGTEVKSIRKGALNLKDSYAQVKNGELFLIDRSPDSLVPTADRPLADEREKLMSLYKTRIDTYMSTADYIIDADCDPDDVADSVINGE